MTNVTDVKPLLTVATYLDKNEATEAYQEVAGAPCAPQGSRWHMQNGGFGVTAADWIR